MTRRMWTLVLLLGLVGCTKSGPAASDAAATVLVVKNNVEVLGADGTKRPAKVKAHLVPTDQVQVGADSWVVLQLKNDYVVKVEEELTLAISDIPLAGAAPAQMTVEAQLEAMQARNEINQQDRVMGYQNRRTAGVGSSATIGELVPNAPAPARPSASAVGELKKEPPATEEGKDMVKAGREPPPADAVAEDKPSKTAHLDVSVRKDDVRPAKPSQKPKEVEPQIKGANADDKPAEPETKLVALTWVPRTVASPPAQAPAGPTQALAKVNQASGGAESVQKMERKGAKNFGSADGPGVGGTLELDQAKAASVKTCLRAGREGMDLAANAPLKLLLKVKDGKIDKVLDAVTMRALGCLDVLKGMAAPAGASGWIEVEVPTT